MSSTAAELRFTLANARSLPVVACGDVTLEQARIDRAEAIAELEITLFRRESEEAGSWLGSRASTEQAGPTAEMAAYGSAHVRLLAMAREQPDGLDFDDDFRRDGLQDLRSVGCLDGGGRLTAFGQAELARLETGGERTVSTPSTKGSPMSTGIDGTASTADIAAKLSQATDEFEDITSKNQALLQQFESHKWSGLEDLSQARIELERARGDLAEVVRKITLAGNVGEAFQKNRMVGDKDSLGRT